jgi:hypothetical protein
MVLVIDGAGEWQLDLEYLLGDVGDVFYLVHPYLAAGAGDGVVAALADPPDQVVIDDREDLGYPEPLRTVVAASISGRTR